MPPSYSTADVTIIPSSSSVRSTSKLSTVDPAQLDSAVAKAVNSYCSSTEFTSQLRDTVREEVEKHPPETNDLISLEKSTVIPPAAASMPLPASIDEILAPFTPAVE